VSVDLLRELGRLFGRRNVTTPLTQAQRAALVRVALHRTVSTRMTRTLVHLGFVRRASCEAVRAECAALGFTETAKTLTDQYFITAAGRSALESR
jgi:hypothetical protein